MTPLALNQKWLVCLNLCSVEHVSRMEKVQRFVCICSMILGNICAIAASVAFFLKFVSINLEEALYAFSLTIAFSGGLYIILIALFTRQKISSIFVNLSELYESSKFQSSNSNGFHHSYEIFPIFQ